MQTKAQKILQIAEKYVGGCTGMVSSAKFCIVDAHNAYNRGDFEAVRMWALKSLAYSVGIFHPSYKEAEQIEIKG